MEIRYWGTDKVTPVTTWSFISCSFSRPALELLHFLLFLCQLLWWLSDETTAKIQFRKMLNKYIQPNLNTSVANESMQGRYSSSQYTASSCVLLLLSYLNSDGTDGFFGSWARGYINDFIWFPFQNRTAVWSECWFSILRLCWLWCTHKVTSAYFSKDILNP